MKGWRGGQRTDVCDVVSIGRVSYPWVPQPMDDTGTDVSIKNKANLITEKTKNRKKRRKTVKKRIEVDDI